MLAAMIAIIVFKLPIFEGQRAFWFLATVLPLTAVGGGFILYGRYWDVPGLLNRRCPRTLCQIPAQIIISAKLPPILCTVIDISEGGAGLSLSVGSTSGIPTSFELVIEGDPTRRACRVAWIQPHTLGVEFQTQPLGKLTAAIGTPRHFVATQQFGRFRSEADIQQAAMTPPDL